jgi:hypothetical protein
MSAVHDGGPAFPGPNPEMTGIDSDGTERWETEPSGGMSLRDYFAGKAMNTMIARAEVHFLEQDSYEPGDLEDFHDYVGEQSYLIADAMLKARK